MKKLYIALAVAIAATLGLSSCGGENYQSAEYSRVCINEQTRQRVDGVRCGSNDSFASSGFLWWYLAYGRALPAYGYPVTGGYRTVRSNAIIEHDERIAPRGGKSYTKVKTRSYSTGNGKKLGTTQGGTGYKAPAPKAPVVKPAPKAPAFKAPVYKAPVKFK